MRSLGIIVVLALACSVYVSHAADQDSRPPGVLARDWIRVSDRLGFVVTHTDGGVATDGGPATDNPSRVLRAPPDRVAADLMPPLKGYFVIQTATGWRQVVMADPATLGR